MAYRDTQKDRVARLLATSSVFNGDPGNGVFMRSHRKWCLRDPDNNLYSPIRDAAKEYFAQNGIAWWGSRPTPHPLSSQIACLNHLFPLRDDADSIFAIARQLDPSISAVLPVASDPHMQAYVAFEVVSDNDHLNEGTLTRGSHCTSVDALIYGERKDGSRILFPIEWKYTESYGNDDKSAGEKGTTRKGRYTALIAASSQLARTNDKTFYIEPFYQLMRQTLWAEQMIRSRQSESVPATDFIHVHVIPTGNRELLKKEYPVSGMQMEETWRGCLKSQPRYQVITPEALLSVIHSTAPKGLIGYLTERYWA